MAVLPVNTVMNVVGAIVAVNGELVWSIQHQAGHVDQRLDVHAGMLQEFAR